MKSLRKKSVHSRKLTYLTAFTMVLALAGCSNTDDESPDLEETTDASVSDPVEYIPASEDGPAENVPEPRLPAETTEHSARGAEATLKYFWDAEAYASLTGDSAPLDAVSSDSCAFCAESIEGWPSNYDQGYWSVTHGDIEVEVTETKYGVMEAEHEDVAFVYFSLKEPPTDFYDESGALLEGSFDSIERRNWIAELIYDDEEQSWIVKGLGLEEIPAEEDS